VRCRPEYGADGFFRAVAWIAFAFLLSACTSNLFGGGTPSVPAVTAPVAGATLGTGAVKVAMLLPLSAAGVPGQVAESMRNAADLAIREFRTAGITVLVKDDRGTADGAQAAAGAAISEGATLILGPVFSASVAAAAQVAKPANIPIIAFSTDATNAAKGVYLLSFLPQADTARIIGYAAGHGKRSYAALLPNNAYGVLVEASLRKAAASGGARIMTVERYDPDRGSMQAKANAVAALARGGTIDGIFIPDGAPSAPFLAQLLAAGGVQPDKIKLLGSSQWDDAAVLNESNLAGAWFPGPEAAGFQSFAQRYQAAFGKPPLRQASLAYDATSLAAGLTGRFGATAFSEKILTSPSGFIGIDGAFRLLPNGLNERGLAIYEIRGGAAVVVEPAPMTFTRGGA
jgi:ABC-type branched-subunit amino acid transport system substrate-binding protein